MPIKLAKVCVSTVLWATVMLAWQHENSDNANILALKALVGCPECSCSRTCGRQRSWKVAEVVKPTEQQEEYACQEVSRGNTWREKAEASLRSVGVLGENSKGAPPNNGHYCYLINNLTLTKMPHIIKNSCRACTNLRFLNTQISVSTCKGCFDRGNKQ